MERQPKILVVDDTPRNIRLLDAMLAPHGYTVIAAGFGLAALEKIKYEQPDLILLDILMPEMDGYEICRRLRDDPATRMLPVVLITASSNQEKARAIEAGADDFITNPFNQAELLARVKSLLRIKAYHDTIQTQAAELAALNSTLERRVQQQVEELDRLGRLRRFFSPQLAEIIARDERLIDSHRQEITVVFCDLRNFTAFSESAEPEEVMRVLDEYYAALGELITQFEATVEHFAGDGLMVFFNDPLPCPEPPLRAVRMAVAMRDRVGELIHTWRKRGHQLNFGTGIALGYATLGKIGFEGRFQYAAIGMAANLAERLCAEAQGGQILVSQRVYTAVEDLVEAEHLPDLVLKGFHKPVAAFNILGLKQNVSSSKTDSVSTAPAGAAAGLTERELDVLRLVAQGLTNAEVADRLILSPLTINAHLRSIYGKLDVKTRAAATRFAMEQHLV
ncbi:MAG: response regulator [Roseiflexaceae bacterium]|nr:response regulator [Roseiflexaceae bacterium]